MKTPNIVDIMFFISNTHIYILFKTEMNLDCHNRTGTKAVGGGGGVGGEIGKLFSLECSAAVLAGDGTLSVTL